MRVVVAGDPAQLTPMTNHELQRGMQVDLARRLMLLASEHRKSTGDDCWPYDLFCLSTVGRFTDERLLELSSMLYRRAGWPMELRCTASPPANSEPPGPDPLQVSSLHIAQDGYCLSILL